MAGLFSRCSGEGALAPPEDVEDDGRDVKGLRVQKRRSWFRHGLGAAYRRSSSYTAQSWLQRGLANSKQNLAMDQVEEGLGWPQDDLHVHDEVSMQVGAHLESLLLPKGCSCRKAAPARCAMPNLPF